MSEDIDYIVCESASEIRWALSMIDSNKLYLNRDDGSSRHAYNEKARYSGICRIIDQPEYYQPAKIVLAKDMGEDIFIGCAIALKNYVHSCNTATYVKSTYRRKGIGSKLVTMAMPPQEIDNNQHPLGFPKVS